MKREHLVKLINSCPANLNKKLDKSLEKEFMSTTVIASEGQRRVKTSAAVIGLALSMSATGMLFSQRDSQVVAAEPSPVDRSVTIPTIAFETPTNQVIAGEGVGLETTNTPKVEVAVISPPVIKHEIEVGDNLWNLSQNYQVEANAIANSNHIEPEATLSVGQSIKIPSSSAPSSANAVKSATPTQEIASVPESDSVNTAIVIPVSVSAPEFSQSVTEAEIPTLSARGTTEPTESAQFQKETVQEKAPIVIPVSVPESLPVVRELEIPTLSIQAEAVNSASNSRYSEENGFNLPRREQQETNQQGTRDVLPRSLPTPEIAAQPGNSRQSETNSSVIEIPVLSSQEQAKENSNTVVVQPPSGFVTPEISVEAYIQPQSLEPQTIGATGQPVYRVQPGDTIDSIARRYGLSRSDIVQANRLNNPNLIEVDQQLQIPASAGVNSTNTYASRPQAEANNVPSINAQLESQTERSLERLREDIISLQQSQNSTVSSRSQPETIEIAVNSTFTDNSVSNPEWEASRNNVPLQVDDFKPAQRPTETRQATPTRTRTQEELIAAAPISVEAYNPMLQTPVGEMVAPNLPSLSSPDQYLPDSPQRFNGFVWPAKGVLTSGYGRRWGRMHRGIDIAAPVGTPIVAAAPGEVITAGWNSGGYGNWVRLKHDDGTITLYAHNNRISVRQGQKVEQGQQIAEMGSTGFSTGPHLHFELHPAGSGAIDPMARLPKR